MAIRCGFFNSINKDRTYSAEEMCEPFAGIVSNGVLVPNADIEPELSESLKVVRSNGLKVVVKAGRGMFAEKWFISDSDITFNVPSNNTLVNQIASIIVRIDKRSDHRRGTIEIIQATDKTRVPSINTITNVVEYRLANITIRPGTLSIDGSDIADTRATSDCGFCHGLIKQLDTSQLFDQWETIFNTWFEEIKSDFTSQATLVTSLTSHYVTATANMTVIPINISQFKYTRDILEVYISGLKLIKNVDYTFDMLEPDQITLTKDVDAGASIEFVVYKSVDGTQAETVVAQVEELQQDVNDITSDSGWINFTLENGAAAYPGMVPAVRKVGNVVYIRGAIYQVTNTQQVVCTLPEAFAPNMEHFFSHVVGGTGAGVGYTTVRFRVNRNAASGGTATITLNGATGSLNANMTIPMSTSFIVG